MLSFLFWNVHRKPLTEFVGELVRRHSVDVLLLVEYPDSNESLLMSLQLFGDFSPIETPGQLRCFTILDPLCFVPQRPPVVDERSAYWAVSPPGLPSFNLGIVHGQGIRYRSQDYRTRSLGLVAKNVEFVEMLEGHQRSALFGDFNANPFDKAMTTFDGLQ